MKFYNNQLFHIYNQGNNGRQLFFKPEDYELFLWKMKSYLLPFGDMISWCLMPNHFHWQFWAKQVKIKRNEFWQHVDKIEFHRRKYKYGKKAQPVQKNRPIAQMDRPILLNDAIGILQQGYTKAINKEHGWSGSLFRKECKAKDGWIDEFITLKNKNGKDDYRFGEGKDYAFQCFSYIHQNPVKAGLVRVETDYIYSSAQDYAGVRSGKLCYIEMGQRVINFL